MESATGTALCLSSTTGRASSSWQEAGETECWPWEGHSWKETAGGKSWEADEPSALNAELYISNLPVGITEDALRKLCSRYGELAEVKIVQRQQKRNQRLCALIAFASYGDARNCQLELVRDGYEPQEGDGPLTVRHTGHQQQNGGKGNNDGKGKGMSVRKTKRASPQKQ